MSEKRFPRPVAGALVLLLAFGLVAEAQLVPALADPVEPVPPVEPADPGAPVEPVAPLDAVDPLVPEEPPVPDEPPIPAESEPPVVDCSLAGPLSVPTAVDVSRVAGGALRISWQHDETCVQEFRVYLRLAKNATEGQQIVTVPAAVREVVVADQQLRPLGAPIGSGRHFFVRLQAVGAPGVPGIDSPLGPEAAALAGQPNGARAAGAARLEIAAYNLAFTPELSRRVLASRRWKVAKQLVASGASVIALSESVQIRGAADTQLPVLLSKLRKAQRKAGTSAAWRLTRSTLYARPGNVMGGDGTRILYNAHRVRLLSACSDVTRSTKTVAKRVMRNGVTVRVRKKVTVSRPYSRSCTIKLPRIGGTIAQRWAPIVRFQDRRSGQKFWFVSAHLEVRKGAVFDENRRRQLDAIQRALKRLNTRNEPVILAGDLNLSVKRTPDLAILNQHVVDRGFVSSATAAVATNLQFPTYNGGNAVTAATAAPSGFASRIDHIYARGQVHIARHSTQLSRASDHHLVRSTVWVK